MPILLQGVARLHSGLSSQLMCQPQEIQSSLLHSLCVVERYKAVGMEELLKAALFEQLRNGVKDLIQSNPDSRRHGTTATERVTGTGSTAFFEASSSCAYIPACAHTHTESMRLDQCIPLDDTDFLT